MCHGDVLCRDGTDLEQCSVLSCGEGQTSCSEGTEMTTARECYDTGRGNDGVFDCLNRNDEENVRPETTVNIDFKDLKKCQTDFVEVEDQDVKGDDGLLCGEKCMQFADWCRKKRSQHCKTNNSSFNTASPELCRNHKFWRNISCERISQSGSSFLTSKGVRCNGAIQQCIFPTYISLYYRAPNSYKRCEDKSDQVFPANRTCNDIALDHHKSYCDTFCTPGQEYQPDTEDKRYNENHDPKCSEKCGDPSSWLSNQTDPYIQDPHLCQDSCQTPDRHCEACSNEKYPRCPRNNVTVCYHMDLWCDGHPVCDGAEDEPIRNVTCYQKLLKRGKC